MPFRHKFQQVFVAESFICHSSAWNREELYIPEGWVEAHCMLCCMSLNYFYMEALPILLYCASSLSVTLTFS